MLDFYSRNDVNYNGDVYSIPFPYMKEEEIQVYLDDVLFADWFFLNDSQIRLRSLPEGVTSDTVVSVRRVTKIDNKVVTYTNNTLLNKENLNLSQDQLLFAVQEIYDNNIQFQIDTDEVIETNKQEVLDIQEAFEQETQQQLLQNKTEIENRVTQFENEVNNTIDEVKEAANKVNELEEAVDTAVTAANTATEQAEIAINQTDETTELVEQFTENIDSKISTNNENMQSVLAETEAVLQEAKDTLGNTLNKSQITNCITEIPQNIKLELSGALLKLKAGSKVSVSTSGTFEDVNITNDITGAGSLHTGEGTRELFVCYSPSENTLITIPVAYTYSSATTPTSLLVDKYAGWFDTSTNTVKYTNDGTTWDICSLPICMGKPISGTGWGGRIDQVFNGFGYIGSTVWVDKGVKGLAPNGRNEDGTLNNRELDSPVVRTVTAQKNQTDFSLVLNNDGLYILAKFNTVTTGTTPTSYGPCYVEETNKAYNNGQWRSWVHIATYSTDSTGNITSFNSKLPVRAVDYNEFNSTPHITETYVNGTSGYNVWSNGYCEQWGSFTSNDGANTTVTFLKAFANTDYNCQVSMYGTAGQDQYKVFVITSKASSSVVIKNITNGSNTCMWRACGYIA